MDYVSTNDYMAATNIERLTVPYHYVHEHDQRTNTAYNSI